MSDETLETRTLKAGTIIHIKGIPVELKDDVQAVTYSANWTIINEPDAPATGKQECDKKAD